MTQAESPIATPPAADVHGGATHAHDPDVAHHFESAEQQFDSGKLGMWTFLATEVLMFGGLFCGYAVWRSNDPASFEYGHRLLDSTMGGINTVVLITSSLTMAWAVRAAQLGQRRALTILLALTLLGGFGFMGIKYMEYSAKFAHGTGPGNWFLDGREIDGEKIPDKISEYFGHGHADALGHTGPGGQGGHADGGGAAAANDAPAPAPASPLAAINEARTALVDPGRSPPGLAPLDADTSTPAAQAGGHDLTPAQVKLSRNFIDVYFLMTGLHGVHVLVGMGLIAWLLVRAARGAFGPTRFAAVDNVGLYWHLVDLIWIFLFPLLYLID